MNRLTKFIKCAALLAAGVLAVLDATGEISVMASREYVDRKVGPKRDKDDYKIYRKVKDCWTWTNWASPDATASAPADFLAAVNSPTAEPVYFANGTWWGANQFWPNGNRKYMKELGPYGTGTELSLNWAFTAYAEDGTTELFRFGATSVRTNATDETLICWDSVNPSVRLVTTDQINGTLKKTDGALRPLPKYLWLYEPDDPYLDDAKAWYTNYDHVVSGGCSALRKGGLLGRNFDFPYDERAEFVVKVPAAGNRRASVGVSNLGTNLTEQFVVSGSPSPLYKVLPGVIVDGINDMGVVAEINVIPRDPTRDPAQGIDPQTGVDRQLSAFAVVRYVLDNFISAAEAAADVAAHYYIPAGSPNSYHWMIADKDGTYIVEDGQVVQPASTTDGCALVNFRVISAGAYDPSGGYATDPYGSGRARFVALTNAPSVQAGLAAVRYTHAYASGWPWPDEFAGASDAQGLIPHDNTARLLAYANDKVAPKLDPTTRKPKTRGNGCWQTVHSAIYDITNKKLRIAVQESGDWHVFQVLSANIPSAISNAAGRIEADLTAYVTMTYDNWTPSHSPIPDNPQDGDVYYSDVAYWSEYGGWASSKYRFDIDEGRWIYTLPTLMIGDYANPDAVELTFPDGAKTYRKQIVKTKLATTNDIPTNYVASDGENVVAGSGAMMTVAGRSGTVVIGRGARSSSNNAVAIGNQSVVSNQGAVSIGNLSRSHGMNTFNVAYGVGSWYAGDTPLVDAIFSTGYVVTNITEVVTNDPPALASRRVDAGPGQVVTNTYRAYVPDPNAPKPVLSGRETAEDLAAALKDANTNETADCECIRSNIVRLIDRDLSSKRDKDDLTYTTYAPGGWIPTEVEGHRYDIYYDGYSGFYVEKLTYYPEWGEWYYDDYEWVEAPEDAQTLVAHKIWSEETITFTREQIELRDSMVLSSQVGNQAEIAARNYIQNNDIEKTKTILRTGRVGEYGTGWGTLHYQFSSDRRWWSIIVPSLTASFSTGGYVDGNGNFVSASTVRFPGQSYAYYSADPISQRDHTPTAKFIESSGTNGSARCASARWSVGITAGSGSSSSSVRYNNSADTDAMPFLLTADVDYARGFVSVATEDRSSVVPIEFDLLDYYTDHYVIRNFRFGELTWTNGSATVKCLYDVDVRYTSSIKTNFTAWCTFGLGCTPGNYVTTTPDYGRILMDTTRGLFYDRGMKATWRLAVTNGCFFTEIISTNNITDGAN